MEAQKCDGCGKFQTSTEGDEHSPSSTGKPEMEYIVLNSRKMHVCGESLDCAQKAITKVFNQIMEKRKNRASAAA